MCVRHRGERFYRIRYFKRYYFNSIPPTSPCLRSVMANLRTMILDFRGFDSSIILGLRGGILMPIGNLPEILSQRILVGIILVGRLCVSWFQFTQFQFEGRESHIQRDNHVLNHSKSSFFLRNVCMREFKAPGSGNKQQLDISGTGCAAESLDVLAMSLKAIL